MTTSTVGHQSKVDYPRAASRDEWLIARKRLCAKEKELTRHRDMVNAERRRLPMVRVDTKYVFDGPEGRMHLLDLFGGRRQLVVYHFMFDPSWDEGCPSCSFLVDNIGHLAHLQARGTSLALVSRAAGEDRAVQAAHGLDDPVGLLVWQRLQLRLPCDNGRDHCSSGIQLQEQGEARGEGRVLFHGKGSTMRAIPLSVARVEPYITPKNSLTGDNTERVDTRVLQIIYRFEPPSFPVYTGQQVDVFIERDGIERHQDGTSPEQTPAKTAFHSTPSEK